MQSIQSRRDFLKLALATGFAAPAIVKQVMPISPARDLVNLYRYGESPLQTWRGNLARFDGFAAQPAQLLVDVVDVDTNQTVISKRVTIGPGRFVHMGDLIIPERATFVINNGTELFIDGGLTINGTLERGYDA